MWMVHLHRLSSSLCRCLVCVCLDTLIFRSISHSRTRHGGSFSESGGEGPTLQLQRDGEGEQMHHSDVRKHHEWVKAAFFFVLPCLNWNETLFLGCHCPIRTVILDPKGKHISEYSHYDLLKDNLNRLNCLSFIWTLLMFYFTLLSLLVLMLHN